MKGLKRLGLSLALAAVLLTMLAFPAAAENPTVTITMSAQIVTITNSQNTWNIGALTAGASSKYFSADLLEDDNYSLITNTGNVAVDIEIRGTNATDQSTGTYNWTLASSAGNKQFSLYANSGNGSTTYNIEVKHSVYNDLTTDLAKSGTYYWSMNLTPPTAFDAADDGSDKVSTVTLVASKHV